MKPTGIIQRRLQLNKMDIWTYENSIKDLRATKKYYDSTKQLDKEHLVHRVIKSHRKALKALVEEQKFLKTLLKSMADV